jgi:hypothetical protein
VAIVVGLAVGLIIAGIIMAVAGKKGLEPGLLATVVFVVGIILIVVGLVILIAPVLMWFRAQFIAMLDLH